LFQEKEVKTSNGCKTLWQIRARFGYSGKNRTNSAAIDPRKNRDRYQAGHRNVKNREKWLPLSFLLRFPFQRTISCIIISANWRARSNTSGQSSIADHPDVGAINYAVTSSALQSEESYDFSKGIARRK